MKLEIKRVRAVLYVRVSTDEQAREGYSIPAQLESLRAFCKSQGWEIVFEYIEEGKSAKDLDRPKMKQMLNDIKKGEIDIILVYRLDRLTRSVLDLYLLLQKFDEHNVAFRSATEVYDTSTAMGRLFITLVAALAQWERENLGERVIFGMEQMIDEGKKPGGHDPYGYRFDKDFNCTIIDEEAAHVRMIYQMFMDGYGYRSIAERMNVLKAKPRHSKTWSHNTIRNMLNNEIYIGTYKWGKKVVTLNKSIIDVVMYKAVQKKMVAKQPSLHRMGKFVLTGLLRCGHCDNSMQGYFDKRKDKAYYRCTKCNRQPPEKQLLDGIVNEIELLITSKQYFLSKVDYQIEDAVVIDMQGLNKELEKIRVQLEKWYDVLMDNKIPKEVIYDRINKLTERENEIIELMKEAEPEETENPEIKYERLSKLKDFKQQFNLGSNFRQKELLLSIFEEIVMYRDKGMNKKITLDYFLR
jgi:site-specific DNA recombinase